MNDSAAPVDGHDAMSRFLRGSEHAADGRVDEAEAEFAQAVLLAPNWHIARFQLGLLQFSGGRPAVGILTWEPLVQREDTGALAHYARGFAALATDEIAGARRHFESGLELGDGNPALAGDIRRVLKGLAEQPPRAGNVDAHDGGGAAPAHVLVSNYGKYGSLH